MNTCIHGRNTSQHSIAPHLDEFDLRLLFSNLLVLPATYTSPYYILTHTIINAEQRQRSAGNSSPLFVPVDWAGAYIHIYIYVRIHCISYTSMQRALVYTTLRPYVKAVASSADASGALGPCCAAGVDCGGGASAESPGTELS